jgi:hypothetical protein
LAVRGARTTADTCGWLSPSRSPDDTALQVAAFRRGLAENGYIEYRFARGEYDQLPALAAAN